jgi:predicted ATPase
MLAIEDAHWADEATLDLLLYLGRRISTTRALVIVTFRDDEVGPRHRLRQFLGDLATANAVQRYALAPLSPAAVATMATGTSLDPEALHARTRGNPFFVTEIIAAGGEIPATVHDAVLARASRLTPSSWATLEAAAVIGSTIDESLLASVAKPAPGELEACLDIGMLCSDGVSLSFRHEIARQTVLAAIFPPRRVALHREVLRVLEAAPAHLHEPELLAHHAEEAGDCAAVLRHALAAAEKAARVQAHREEASQYERALRFSATLPDEDRARLLEARSHACYLTAQIGHAITAREAAMAIWTQRDNTLRVGENRCHLATLLWAQARVDDAEREAEAAVELLERVPPGPQLAMAYGTLARLRGTTLADDDAMLLGQKAIALAERAGTVETLIDALLTVGEAKLELVLID